MNAPHTLNSRQRLIDSTKELLGKIGESRVRKVGRVSFKTRYNRRTTIYRFVRLIHDELGFEIGDINNLSWKHVQALLQYFEEEELAPKTVTDYVSILRLVLRGIGRDKALRLMECYLDERRDLVAVRSTTTIDRSLLPTGVSFEEKFTLVCKENPRVAAVLLLQWTFSLRPKEARHFRPRDCFDEQGRIKIKYGTKGGRERVWTGGICPVEVEAATLLFASRFARKRSSNMIPEDSSCAAFRREYYRVMDKVGFTRRKLGRASYALRHGALLALFAQTAGIEARVRGGGEIDPYEERAIRKLLAEQAGHNRMEASSPYVGSPVAPLPRASRKVTAQRVAAAYDTLCERLRVREKERLPLREMFEELRRNETARAPEIVVSRSSAVGEITRLGEIEGLHSDRVT